MQTHHLGLAALPVARGLACLAARPQVTFTPEEQALVDEHAPYGLPSTQNVHVRQGYVRAYDPARRVPLWSAYHIHPDYRQTPPRRSRFSTFRVDPDVQGAKDPR